MPVEWSLSSCADVSDEDIEIAFEPQRSPADPPPRDRVVALLRKMAEVARPSAEAPRILLVLARLARSGLVRGVLEIKLRRTDRGVSLDVTCDDGVNVERVFRATELSAPLSEFEAFFAEFEKKLAPLSPKPSVEPSTFRLLGRAATPAGASSRRMLAAPPVAMTVRRAVPLPVDARRPDASQKKPDDDGWD
ncbi:MAG: hypothetical protein IT374_07510 [Polyangiaceae bacterium]|nr:hypothetical protein [Polyangiaceae bacterium]